MTIDTAACDELDRLKAENRRLRAALEYLKRGAPMPGCECKAVAAAVLAGWTATAADNREIERENYAGLLPMWKAACQERDEYRRQLVELGAEPSSSTPLAAGRDPAR